MIGTGSLSNTNNTLENWAWFLDSIGVRYRCVVEKRELKHDPEDDELICLVVDRPVFIKETNRYNTIPTPLQMFHESNNVRIVFRKSTHEFVRISTDINRDYRY